MAAAAAGRPPRRGPTIKQAQRPITSFDPETETFHHRKIGAAEARNRAAALPLDTDPDTVQHPQVRKALVDRFVDIEREEEDRAANGGKLLPFPTRSADAGSSPPAPGRGGVLSRQVTTVAGHSVSLASLPLGMLAYAALINLINGTFRRWASAKLTNAGGSLP